MNSIEKTIKEFLNIGTLPTLTEITKLFPTLAVKKNTESSYKLYIDGVNRSIIIDFDEVRRIDLFISWGNNLQILKAVSTYGELRSLHSELVNFITHGISTAPKIEEFFRKAS